jgi:hypothetical protein
MYKSKQEIFDKVVNHLKTQGGKAVDIEGNCLYRDPAGRSCAAGCLIPDDIYEQEIGSAHNSLGFAGLVSLSPPVKSLFETVQEGAANAVELVRSLQLVHDGEKVTDWKSRLSVLAARHGLNTTVLEGWEST